MASSAANETQRDKHFPLMSRIIVSVAETAASMGADISVIPPFFKEHLNQTSDAVLRMKPQFAFVCDFSHTFVVIALLGPRTGRWSEFEKGNDVRPYRRLSQFLAD